MSSGVYQQLQAELRESPATWLVTGVAGFIGSNLLETLLKLDQRVIGLDNLSTGNARNLDQVKVLMSSAQWDRFRFIQGDITQLGDCREACARADFVLHQAALGSVPRSIEEPMATHASNVSGFLNMLIAAKGAKVKGFVYASSSAVYGDSQELPKVEGREGTLLSPYAASKAADELFAESFASAYGFNSIGLRYFNVFGPRQDPEGTYAAVVPRWVSALLHNEPIHVNGDGETSRDFCYIDNVVQANLLAANPTQPAAQNQVYNIAIGDRTTLNQLFEQIQTSLQKLEPGIALRKPAYRDFRAGDVRHSLADITKAKNLLGYSPTHNLAAGLDLAMAWYRNALAGHRT